MESINAIKDAVHRLEMDGKRTPIRNMLVSIYEEHPTDSGLASLCMRQMVMFLDELEGDPEWGKRERDDEYEDYSAFLQRILSGYNTLYKDNIEFQWSLCYYLRFIPTYHFILGDTIQYDEAEHIRTGIIDRFIDTVTPLKLFEFIDQIQTSDRHFIAALGDSETRELQMEIEGLDLQDNYADRDLRAVLQEWSGLVRS
ncbi:MAG: hypothetical protein Q4G19_05620 [Clostridia bacterium]|nr:hypothetical protein [Clostridia bacterium]